MAIYVIRHGETLGNRSRKVQKPDVPLSDTGHQQASLLASRLADSNISAVLCSDYLRAQQTAAPIIDSLRIPVTYSPLLRERNFGDLRGQKYDDIDEDFFAQDYIPPNGESWQVFDQRVADAWQHTLEHAKAAIGDLAVITHGLVCLRLVSNHTKVTGGVSIPTHWGNTSVTEVSQKAPHHVRFLNCTTHIEDENLRTVSGGKV